MTIMIKTHELTGGGSVVGVFILLVQKLMDSKIVIASERQLVMFPHSVIYL